MQVVPKTQPHMKAGRLTNQPTCLLAESELPIVLVGTPDPHRPAVRGDLGEVIRAELVVGDVRVCQRFATKQNGIAVGQPLEIVGWSPRLIFGVLS